MTVVLGSMAALAMTKRTNTSPMPSDQPRDIPMTIAVVPHTVIAVEEALLPPPARQPRVRRRLVLIILAVVVFVAALPFLGLDGLIPFGLLLAFSTGSDEDET